MARGRVGEEKGKREVEEGGGGKRKAEEVEKTEGETESVCGASTAYVASVPMSTHISSPSSRSSGPPGGGGTG